MSISIDNYASQLYHTYESQNSTSSKLQDTLSKDYASATDEELMGVCKEFEAYFAEQVFKSLQKMVPENEEESSNQTLSYFKDMMIQEYAKSATEGEGLGLAKMMYESMKREYINGVKVTDGNI